MKTKIFTAALMVVVGCLGLFAGYLMGFRKGIIKMSCYDVTAGTVIAQTLRMGDSKKALGVVEALIEMRASDIQAFKPAAGVVVWIKAPYDSLFFSDRSIRGYLSEAGDYVTEYPDANIHPDIQAYLKSLLADRKNYCPSETE